MEGEVALAWKQAGVCCVAAAVMLLVLSCIMENLTNEFKKGENGKIEWIEEVWLKQGKCSSTLPATDMPEGNQGLRHENHNKYCVERRETPLFGSSSLSPRSCLYSPHNDTCILACWTLDSGVCVFWALSSEPKIRKRTKRKHFPNTA